MQSNFKLSALPQMQTERNYATPVGEEAQLSPTRIVPLPVDENLAASAHLEPGPAIWPQTWRKGSHIGICTKQGCMPGSTYQLVPSGVVNIRL